MRRRISRKVKKNLEAYSSLSDYTQETYSGINVIKAYVKEKRRAFLFQDYNKENMDTCLDFVQDQVIVQVVINTILAIVTAGIIFIGGYIIYSAVNSNNTLDFKVGDLISFNAYFASLVWPVMAIGDLINLRGQSKAAEKRISDLLDEQVEINDLNKELLIDENPSGKICFNDVTFRYPDTNVDVLKNISFTIDSGSFTGIMGPTGAGKSTIVELLLRLYNLEDNKILIDDLDIMHLKIKDIRDMIAYAPQEVFLFKQSISSNIAFSSDEIDLPKVQDAASFAGIAKDISEFTKGYDTVLGERGVTVSGGQKQRITIARALIKDAPILILDDSLSAVDTITEKEILSYLRKTRAGKTTIIIAHRITTLETLDKIIVVNKGMIEAVGTHEELLQTSSTYQKEVHLQELEKEVEA
jgi:ATP-binding cassette subfamily B protein